LGDLHVGAWDSVSSAHLKGVDSNTEDDGKDTGKDSEVKIFLAQERDSTSGNFISNPLDSVKDEFW